MPAKQERSIEDKQRDRIALFYGNMRAQWSLSILGMCPGVPIDETVAVAEVLVANDRFLARHIAPEHALATLDDQVLLQLRTSGVRSEIVDVVSHWRSEGQRLSQPR